ncbi:MAG: hypothetical protein ABJB32_03435 [Verrucomicrobiota bacterium]
MLVICAGAFLVTVGCNDNSKITVYRVPKETKPQTADQVSAEGDAGAIVRWKAPSGWEEQLATGFRKGSFIVRSPDGRSADISVVSFPESAGGLLANVNRWRSQLKLAPVNEIDRSITPLSVDGHQVFFVDIVSEQPVLDGGLKSRVLGGILATGGETWFFKMSGEDKLVASQRDVFRQFLETLDIGKGAATTATSTNAPTPPPIEAPEKAPLQYALPAGWQEQPLSSMRVASFKVSGQNGKEADVSVVSLPGVAGGNLANVNRWRDQLKLSPIDANALVQSAEQIEANGHDFLIVDLVSESPISEQHDKIRILAAILNENDRSWFVKMTGEEQLVASQKTAFVGFLRSLAIP